MIRAQDRFHDYNKKIVEAKRVFKVIYDGK